MATWGAPSHSEEPSYQPLGVAFASVTRGLSGQACILGTCPFQQGGEETHGEPYTLTQP